MDQAYPLIPLSPDAEVNKYLVKINKKLEQLKSAGLTEDDHKNLESRLSVVWGEPEEADLRAGDAEKLKIWRHNRARQRYAEIQEKSDHVFLAVILAISPTESVKTSFQNVARYLLHLDDYKPYQLSLSSADKRFFESISVKQDFTGNRQYLLFMEAVFPQGKERGTERGSYIHRLNADAVTIVIQYAYSYVPIENIPAFLKEMEEGIYHSRHYTDEENRKVKASSCLSVLLTGDDDDGGCTLVINRNVLLNAINKFGLSELKLE